MANAFCVVIQQPACNDGHARRLGRASSVLVGRERASVQARARALPRWGRREGVAGGWGRGVGASSPHSAKINSLDNTTVLTTPRDIAHSPP
jgi:hypothetical protein